MIRIRKSENRGKANYGWLNANYSFSFGNYFDPEHTGFRDLLVLNQDIIEAEGGFEPHPHRDMEIITYIIEGELEHKDSLGNTDVIKKGQVQRMSAGTGIRHSEYNPSKKNKTQLLQIWIQTGKKGIEPDFESVQFPVTSGKKLLVSPHGGNESARINQDFRLYGVSLEPGEQEKVKLAKGRHAWVQIVKGEVELSGHTLKEGDGAAISEMLELIFESKEYSEFLVMDLK